MRIKKVNERVLEQTQRFGVLEKLRKQAGIFINNPYHPSLHTEKLQPKEVGLFSFRISRQFRAIFRIRDGAAEIIKISKHYEE